MSGAFAFIGGPFTPEVRTALNIAAAVERTSIQALLAEGINAVFPRRHKAQIAALSSQTLIAVDGSHPGQ